MGNFHGAICGSYGRKFQVNRGSGMGFHLLHCERCGSERQIILVNSIQHPRYGGPLTVFGLRPWRRGRNSLSALAAAGVGYDLGRRTASSRSQSSSPSTIPAFTRTRRT